MTPLELHPTQLHVRSVTIDGAGVGGNGVGVGVESGNNGGVGVGACVSRQRSSNAAATQPLYVKTESVQLSPPHTLLTTFKQHRHHDCDPTGIVVAWHPTQLHTDVAMGDITSSSSTSVDVALCFFILGYSERAKCTCKLERERGLTMEDVSTTVFFALGLTVGVGMACGAACAKTCIKVARNWFNETGWEYTAAADNETTKKKKKHDDDVWGDDDVASV